MRKFMGDGRVNFVDENDVYVGYDYEASSCESFGWYYSHKHASAYKVVNPGERFERREFVGVLIEDDRDMSGFFFDPDFFIEHDLDDSWDVAAEAVFKLENPKTGEVVYLHLFNHHNGYYGHGFKLEHKGSSSMFYNGCL